MTKEELFNYFYTNNANLNGQAIIMIMLAALAVSIIIFLTYWSTNKWSGALYNAKFNLNLIIVNLISVVIMLMISSNIVISLGMVGALSIVRFRTAIKDSRDTVFIFWAITEGLCVGSLNYRLAIFTTLFISITIILFCYFPKIHCKYLLVVTGDSDVDINKLIETIKPFIKNYKLRTMNKAQNFTELIIEIKTKGEINPLISDKVLKVKGIETINWVSESNETLG